MRWLFVLATILLLFVACGSGKHAPFGGPSTCPNCAGSPPPTSGPANGVACTYTPPPTTPFAIALAQPGLTQKGNNTCVPTHEFTEVEYDSSFCTTACNAGTGFANLNTYADWAEDGTAFTGGPSNNLCEVNYPYNVAGAGYLSGAGPPGTGACKPMKYVNPNILHSNEQIAVVGGSPLGPNNIACTKPGTGIKFYGTPTHNELSQPGMLGDDATQAAADLDIEHDGVATTTAHRIYFTDQTGCKNTSGGPTPSQNYLGYLGSSHLQHWMASLESGATISGVCAYGNSTTFCGPSAAGGFADEYLKYENDQSATSIVNQTTAVGANAQPTNPPSAQTTTQHWASDQAMVNDRVALFNSETHQFGTTCVTAPTCIATGTGIIQQFNGLTNAIVNGNSCYLYTAALTGNYASTNVLDGELEQPTSAFSGRVVEPRDWPHVINCISDIFANTNGQVFFNDHQTLAASYQFYYDVFAVKMLAWSNGRISSELRLDDGGACGTQCNPNLTVYPLQMLVPDPTVAGSPALTKFAPAASTNGRDANGYDASSNNNGDFGSGCDAHDNSTDGGAEALLAATLTKSTNLGTPACTGAGWNGQTFSNGTITCSPNTTPCDYKGNPQGVYVREFANMYYNGSPITNAPISSAANYMAVVLNPTEFTYIVQCGDLPLEGGANYLHIVTALPATPTANSMDMVNLNGAAGLTATTGFTCGTTTVAAESALILVK